MVNWTVAGEGNANVVLIYIGANTALVRIYCFFQQSEEVACVINPHPLSVVRTMRFWMYLTPSFPARMRTESAQASKWRRSCRIHHRSPNATYMPFKDWGDYLGRGLTFCYTANDSACTRWGLILRWHANPLEQATARHHTDWCCCRRAHWACPCFDASTNHVHQRNPSAIDRCLLCPVWGM
jgi:hypothetical protein